MRNDTTNGPSYHWRPRCAGTERIDKHDEKAVRSATIKNLMYCESLYGQPPLDEQRRVGEWMHASFDKLASNGETITRRDLENAYTNLAWIDGTKLAETDRRSIELVACHFSKYANSDNWFAIDAEIDRKDVRALLRLPSCVKHGPVTSSMA